VPQYSVRIITYLYFHLTAFDLDTVKMLMSIFVCFNKAILGITWELKFYFRIPIVVAPSDLTRLVANVKLLSLVTLTQTISFSLPACGSISKQALSLQDDDRCWDLTCWLNRIGKVSSVISMLIALALSMARSLRGP